MSEWKEATLGELINVKHGWAFKGEFFSESSSPKNIIVGIGNFNYSGGFRFESTRLKEYSDEYPKEYELNPGDILLAMTCQTAGGEILGIPGRIPDDKKLYLHNQRLGKIEIKHPKLIDSSFIYWLCLWKLFNHHLVSTASGTKILHTAPDRIKSFKFKYPPIESQKEIGKTLNALDAKIDNLRRQNETLEEIARSIFKHWFIDFEFPNPDGKPYKSSGGAMVRSELGDIPEGWEVGKLGDVVEVFMGYPFKSDLYTFESGTRVVRGENVSLGFLRWDTEKRWEHDLNLYTDYFLSSDDYVIGMDGSRVGRNRTIVLDSDLPLILAQRVARLRAKDSHTQGYVNILLMNIRFERYVDLVKTGTSIPHISGQQIKDFECMIPSQNSLSKFSIFYTAWSKKVSNIRQQIETLTKTRDALLPKLMSGQLRVNE